MVLCCFRGSKADTLLETESKSITKRKKNDKGHFYPNFIDEVQEKSCLRILAKLSEDEKETAARSSYQYLVTKDSMTNSKSKSNSNSNSTSDSRRDAYALAMVRRHLVAENNEEEMALSKLKNTLRFRKDINIDAIRLCFDKEEEEEEFEKLRKAILSELKNGKYFVRGNDVDSSSIYLVMSRIVGTGDPDWYLIGQIYNIERAIARTERLSGGEVEKINVVFDYQDFERKNNPPLALIKELIVCLKDHYPERMARLLILDAPLSFRSIWALIKPFMDPKTRKKVMFVSGDNQKKMKLAGIFPKDQAMKCLLPDGTKGDDVDMETYLRKIPFDYDVDNM